ncbi:MAG TPA: lipid II flippase MurJ [Candidatus Limnocylindrales bacterium]
MPWVDDTSRGRMLSRVGAAQAALYEDEDGDGPPEDPSPLNRLRRISLEAIPRGALILAVLSLVNAGAGFVAKKAVGHFFGQGPEADAFWNAVQLTQFPVDLLITGGIIGPFLPLFLGLKGEAEQNAREFARTILTAALIAMSVAIALMIVLAPELSTLAAPGFVGSQHDLHVNLIRVVCFGQLAITASLVLGEVLVSERRFISYGLAECASYTGLALGAVVLGGLFGFGIYGAAIGFLVGSAGHLGVRLFGIFRTSFRPKFSLRFRTKGVGEFAVLMLPKMASQGLLALLLLYFNQIASTLAPGSTSSISYARDFQSTAESFVGLSFGLAAFPALSTAVAAGNKRAFKRIMRTNALTIGVLSVAAAITLAVMAGFISSLFRGGNFDDTDASRMTLVLVIYAASVPFESLVEIYARGIYATHNTSEPLISMAAGFVAGFTTTMILSAYIGLAALPLGYVVFEATRLVVLVVFLGPRVASIGGSSRWSRALVHDRWGGMAAPERRSTPMGQIALVAVLLLALTAATVFAAVQATGSSVAAAPQITGRPVEPSAQSSIVLPQPSGVKTASASSSDQLPAAPSATPSGPFSMDLYKKGDFVSESKDTWCVAAAMQTSENMMSSVVDVSRDRQAQLFDLAVSMAGESADGADPDGWAAGLSYLGYGRFQTGANATLVGAVHTVAKQIRLTGRPGGLIVWKGWHSWVMSGFTASADPATTDNFTVLSVFIEDVWYPRVSTLWPKSRAPDANVAVSALPPDYVPWDQGKVYADRQGLYVYVIPQV